jgi:hypothetical protein
VAEVLEEPERARRAHPRLLVVDDHRRVRVDAAQVEEVIDDPHERFQRPGIRVDKRETPEIEVHGARHVPRGEILGGPQIDDERLRWTAERVEQLGGRGEQLGVRVAGHPASLHPAWGERNGPPSRRRRFGASAITLAKAEASRRSGERVKRTLRGAGGDRREAAAPSATFDRLHLCVAK